MLFASPIFLYVFLPGFIGVYYLAPRRLRNWIIAIASYVFYGWWRPDFVLLMWGSTIVDYWCGRGIERDHGRGRSGKRFVVLSCCVNLGLLGYFKYANFGVDSLNAILGAVGHDGVTWTQVILPVGISFYTFQTLSYTVDVYRKQATPVRSFVDFASYVAMFPQLVAGPIVRYQSIAEQLVHRPHTWAKFRTGLIIFQAGLVKKVLIADTLAVPADLGFAESALSCGDAWIAALAYTFQIYFDFSGYSDMAIGLGLLIGFRFPINFNRPYVSRSVTEFWRRWHISLSSFLRDYLYIPLGGNRKGTVRTYVNLGLTMLIGGLWHGAAWTFIVWGAYQGFWLIVERLSGRRSFYAWLPSVMQNAITFVIVVFGWVIFRAETLTDALSMIRTMLGLGGRASLNVLPPLDQITLATFVIAPVVVWFSSTTQAHVARPRAWWTLSVAALFMVALAVLHDAANVPFLYFQF